MAVWDFSRPEQLLLQDPALVAETEAETENQQQWKPESYRLRR